MAGARRAMPRRAAGQMSATPTRQRAGRPAAGGEQAFLARTPNDDDRRKPPLAGPRQPAGLDLSGR
jgi:hypothetical protein